VSENRYLDLKWTKWQGAGEGFILGWSSQGGSDWRDMQHAWGDEKYVQNFGQKAWMEETTRKT